MMKLALATFASAAFLAVLSPAHARPSDCEEWGCGMNGTQLTGVADPAAPDRDRLEWSIRCDLFGCGSNGRLSDGRALEGEPPAVNSITLPTGEAIEWR